jgi:hypothetical protein
MEKQAVGLWMELFSFVVRSLMMVFITCIIPTRHFIGVCYYYQVGEVADQSFIMIL